MKIHDEDFDEVLYSSVNINSLDINSEYMRVPADIAYWNAKVAQATKRALMSKIVLSQTAARLRIECRADLELQSAKVTESMVDAAVETNEEMEAARIASVTSETDLVYFKGMAEAVRAKKDVLQSLGANLRAEAAHDPLIREQLSASRQRS